MVTLQSRSRTKQDYQGYGVWTILTFSDGSTVNIQRQSAAESFIGGWHLLDVGIQHTWLADTEKDAIAELLRRKNK